MTKRYAISNKKASIVFNKTGGTCYYCKEPLPPNTEYLDWDGKPVSFRRNWNIHHIIPISENGTYDIENLVPACIQCHGETHRKRQNEN